ncbi:hypothetical protein BT96DRAFT_920301 [Gymnopus androsaceus JB14]|uniref:Uncharacterized protein n=1 Tax=Gymnopus androsaceus JB14 TaxID=1447944 RepID=A0A6A4HQC3_9AGAR|nr:hypothetical protein BT96DRAFT_920301 [Gymnopus androsaceus JB14]
MDYRDLLTSRSILYNKSRDRCSQRQSSSYGCVNHPSRTTTQATVKCRYEISVGSLVENALGGGAEGALDSKVAVSSDIGGWCNIDYAKRGHDSGRPVDNPGVNWTCVGGGGTGGELNEAIVGVGISEDTIWETRNDQRMQRLQRRFRYYQKIMDKQERGNLPCRSRRE